MRNPRGVFLTTDEEKWKMILARKSRHEVAGTSLVGRFCKPSSSAGRFRKPSNTMRPVRDPLGSAPSPALAFDLGLLGSYRTVSVNATGSPKSPNTLPAWAYSV